MGATNPSKKLPKVCEACEEQPPQFWVSIQPIFVTAIMERPRALCQICVDRITQAVSWPLSDRESTRWP